MATVGVKRDEDSSRAGGPPSFLLTLARRYEPEVIDVPGGRARIRLAVGSRDWDAVIDAGELSIEPAAEDRDPDALLSAGPATWRSIADDVRGGMDAFRARKLSVRRNLHLGVGFLAATSGVTDPGRLRFSRVRTSCGELSMLEAGTGEPVLCLHGLGGTKASFLSTVSALASEHRVIAVDLPGFGDSDKPITGAYDPPYFACAVTSLLDELGLERVHLVGNSMGGRVALEVGLTAPERVETLALLSPAVAWLRDRGWKWLLRLPVARLGLIQPTPRVIAEPIVRRIVPGGNEGWSAAGVDEFLRAFLTPSGRAAFYASASNIYLDEPHGDDGFWTRLAALAPRSLFVWGRQDPLVPISFMRHVERALPAASHLELDCGHVPQMERPRETHAAMLRHFRD
ncbi:MAG: alpha/beta fold hydrolase [Solirubrobacterales bacterium]